MYRIIDDFISDYKMESENTVKMFQSIDPGKKSLKINANIRSMERIAWHIVQTLTEMMFKTCLFESDVLEGKPIPQDLDEIIGTYRQQVEKVLEKVKTQWTDNELPDKIEIYSDTWTKGFLLRSLVTHEIHHRAQLTVVMRYYGLKVPGIYGPSREEWANFKMASME
jgi:uncharacterized damage-inducible protein DinB